jgi:hypothetical protein
MPHQSLKMHAVTRTFLQTAQLPVALRLTIHYMRLSQSGLVLVLCTIMIQYLVNACTCSTVTEAQQYAPASVHNAE